MSFVAVSDRSFVHWFKVRFYGLAQTGMMSLASQGINSANNFITGIFLGRLCTKEEYGLYALGFSLMLLINDFQSTLISTPYMIYSPRLQRDEKRQYAGSTFVHQLSLSSIVSFIILCGLGAVYSGMVSQDFTRVLKVLAIVITFIMLKDFFRQMSFAALNVKAALMLDSAAALIQIGSMSLLAYFGALSADRTFMAIGLACGLTSLGWLSANRNMFVVNLKTVLSDLHQKWKLVKWLLASQLLWISAMGLYPWLIAAFLGVRANGIWAACQGLVMIGNLICVAAQNLMGPKLVHVLARGGVAEMRDAVFKSVLLMVFIMTILAIVFFVFGDSLVVLFYGSKYGGNGLIISLLALNLVVTSMTYPFSRGLFALERTDMDFFVNLAIVITLVLGVWLVRTYGLAGAAFGLLVTNSLSVLLRGLAFNRVVTAAKGTTAA